MKIKPKSKARRSSRAPSPGFFLSGFLPAVRVTAKDEGEVRAAVKRARPKISIGEFVRRAVKEKIERDREG